MCQDPIKRLELLGTTRTLFIVPRRQGGGGGEENSIGGRWDKVWSALSKIGRSLLDPSQYEKRLSIDHSLCFSPGLLELLEVLQDDVI